MRKTLITTALALILVPAALAQENTFLRFEMVAYETDEAPTEVKLRIPLSLIAAFDTQIDEAIEEVRMHNENLDLRAIWAEVRAAGPNEYVYVNSEDTKLNISTTETHVRILATDDENREITALIPLALGDLLFGSDQSNAQELIAVLATFTDQDLLTIEGDGIDARAWIEVQ